MYRLSHRDSMGATRSIPQDSHSYLPLNTNPPWLPPGKYDILYFDVSLTRVPTRAPAVLMVSHDHSGGQLGLELDRAGSAPPQANPLAKVSVDSKEEEDEEEDEDEEEEEQEAPGHADREPPPQDPMKLLRMQLRLERHQQRFIRASKYTQEVGETHHLNAILRRELVERDRHIAQVHRQTFDDIKRIREEHQCMREDFRNVMDLWDEAMERAAGKLAAPPPPPTDFTGLGQSALHLLEKLGVALITKNSPTPALPAAASASDRPALEASQADKPEPAPAGPQNSQSSAPAGPQSPLARLGAKLASLGEVEIARRMAGAGGWKSLFDELSAEIEGEPPANPITKAIKDE